MKVVARTEQGRRKNNEDSYFEYCNDRLYGGMIADGMGGQNKGDMASKLAGNIIKEHIMSHFRENMDSFDVSEMMREAVLKANEKIYQISVKNPICIGMGTTVTISMVFESWLITAHVGDSRAYLLNDDGIERITRDHSFVGELVENGSITEEEAKRHPKRNCITRAVGTERSIMVDVDVRKYNGETVLLCSDGLWAYVADREIYDLVKNSQSYEEAAERLVEFAELNNSNDNITVIIFTNKKTK